jgi:polyhydroxyalkanoate synthesis regulator phasin
MGLMDKVKAAAQDITAEAKKATAQGKTKLDQAQSRKKMNDAAEQLGFLIYNERAKGVSPGSEADRLVAEIGRLEAEIASLEVQAPATTQPQTPGATEAPASDQPPGAPETGSGDKV